MKKTLSAIILMISMYANAEHSFYVVMKDGSVEYYPVEKVDSVTYKDPNVKMIRGINDMAAEIFKLRREIDSLKANCCKENKQEEIIDFSIDYSMGFIKLKDLSKLGLSSDTLVDLGLSVKWANMNVGAQNCYDFGDYYYWGATKEIDNYIPDSCEYFTWDTLRLLNEKICDEKNILVPSHDVAKSKWGSSWRIPTKEEASELTQNTVSRWISIIVDDSTIVGGMYFKSLINGKSLFIPATGTRSGSETLNPGKSASYWLSNASTGVQYSWCMYLDYSRVLTGNDKRYFGLPVRPVSDK